MHSGGMPCEMDALLELARRHGLRVVEDASHAHGATYKGRKVGTFGDVAAFSLQTSKLCPAGEGGVLLTDDDALLRRATALGHYERLGRDEGPSGGREADAEEDEYARFRHTSFGYKYRISPLNAALGRVSLAKLDERNRRRNAGIEHLLDGLSEVPGLIRRRPSRTTSSGSTTGSPASATTPEFGGAAHRALRRGAARRGRPRQLAARSSATGGACTPSPCSSSGRTGPSSTRRTRRAWPASATARGRCR